MPSIFIAQFYTSNVSYGDYAKSINQKYALEKGYGYYCETSNEKIFSTLGGKSPTWYKPALVLEIFREHSPEYVLFLDMDAIVSDNNQRIEDFIDTDYDFVAAQDVSTHSLMNAGVFLIKNTEWSKNFLQEWFECSDKLTPRECTYKPLVQETDLDYKGYYDTRLWHDQTALTYLYHDRQEFRSNIKIISNRSFNWKTYDDGNFIFHAYEYGYVPHRTLDRIYNKVFSIQNTDSTDSLATMSQEYLTDKSYEHNYYNLIYDTLFKDKKTEVTKIVEIGVYTGESLRLWRDYFTNAEIIGVDIDTNVFETHQENTSRDRITLIQADQSTEEDLLSITNIIGEVDVIIDDGSHRMLDQQFTFSKLFKNLKSKGIYVIEDLHTSLEAVMPEKRIFNWGDPEKTLTLNMLSDFQKNRKLESDYISEEDLLYLNTHIDTVNIYRSKPDWSIVATITKK
jgi:hypothetical protein